MAIVPMKLWGSEAPLSSVAEGDITFWEANLPPPRVPQDPLAPGPPLPQQPETKKGKAWEQLLQPLVKVIGSNKKYIDLKLGGNSTKLTYGVQNVVLWCFMIFFLAVLLCEAIKSRDLTWQVGKECSLVVKTNQFPIIKS